MKKLFPVLALALVLIGSAEAFANSSKFGFLADSSKNLNSLRFCDTQNQSSVDTGSSRHVENKNLRLKDPSTALLYAIIPGFVIHGAGHFYAGKTKTGFILLGTEFITIGLWTIGALMEFGESEGDVPGDPGVPIAIGTVLFYGSWIYDIFRSPVEVKKRNEKLLKSGNIDIEFVLNKDSYCLRLTKRF